MLNNATGVTLYDVCAVLLILAVALLILCPPRYDPAIRWKERMEKLKQERENME